VKIDNDKFLKYLSGELNQNEAKDFEKQIDENQDLKSIINDLDQNDKVLKNLNNHRVSSDFMIKLNQKIDAYEESLVPWYSKLLNALPSFSSINLEYKNYSQAAVFSLLLIVSFTIYKVSNGSNDMVDKGDIYPSGQFADNSEEDSDNSPIMMSDTTKTIKNK